MNRSAGIRSLSGLFGLRWVGIFRVGAAVAAVLIPPSRSFFSDVREARVEARSGELDAEDAGNLCILDGIASVAYGMAFFLVAMALDTLLFDLFDMPGVALYEAFVLIVVAALLATTAVESFEYLRIYTLAWIRGEGAIVRLAGHKVYLLFYVIAFVPIALVFRSWLSG